MRKQITPSIICLILIVLSFCYLWIDMNVRNYSVYAKAFILVLYVILLLAWVLNIIQVIRNKMKE